MVASRNIINKFDPKHQRQSFVKYIILSVKPQIEDDYDDAEYNFFWLIILKPHPQLNPN